MYCDKHQWILNKPAFTFEMQQQVHFSYLSKEDRVIPYTVLAALMHDACAYHHLYESCQYNKGVIDVTKSSEIRRDRINEG